MPRRFLQSPASCTLFFSPTPSSILHSLSSSFSAPLSPFADFFAPFPNCREKKKKEQKLMKMKNCELCKGLARVHCASDRASLCWSCDYKVHAANFLVERHSRTLLCHVCQSPTPWTATGLKLGPTVSICDSCVQNYDKINANEGSEIRYEDEEMESDNFNDEEDDDDDEEYDCEEDTDSEDNQVVPWSPSTPPPPSTADSPSNSDEESYSSSSVSLPREAQRKRTREDTDRCYNVNCIATPSEGNAVSPMATAAVKDDSSGEDKGTVDPVDSLSTIAEVSLKKRRIKTDRSIIPGSRSWVIVESIKRLQQEKIISSEGIVELRRLSEELSAVDYDSSDSTELLL